MLVVKIKGGFRSESEDMRTASKELEARKETKSNQTNRAAPKFMRRFKSFFKGYGLSYSIVMLDSAQLEIFFFVCLNLVMMSWTTPMIIGFCISLSFILYYIMSEVFIFKLSNLVWREVVEKRLNELPMQKSSNNEKFEDELNSVVQVFDLKYGIFGAAFEAQRIPRRKLETHAPLILSLKNIFTVALLVGFVDSGVVQVCFLVAVEISYLFLIVKSNVKASRLEQLVDCFEVLMNILYMAGCLISFAKMSEWYRQKVVGMVCCLSLVLLALSVTAFVLFSMVNAIISKLKSKKKDSNSKQELASLNQSRVHPKPQRNSSRLAFESSPKKHTKIQQASLLHKNSSTVAASALFDDSGPLKNEANSPFNKGVLKKQTFGTAIPRKVSEEKPEPESSLSKTRFSVAQSRPEPQSAKQPSKFRQMKSRSFRMKTVAVNLDSNSRTDLLKPADPFGMNQHKIKMNPFFATKGQTTNIFNGK